MIKNTESLLGTEEIIRRFIHSYTEFEGDLYIDNITGIPSSQSSPFINRTGITSVDMPNLTTVQKDSLFKGCTGLESVNMPALSGTTSYIGSMFEGCTSLKNADFPSLTMLPKNFLYKCTALERACFFEVTQYFQQGYGIGSCPNLQILRFPKYKNGTQFAVGYGSNLTKMKLLDAGGAYFDANQANRAIRYSKIVILRRTTAIQTIGGLSCTDSTTPTPIKVYVPSSLIESYKTASNWSAAYTGGYLNFLPLEGSPYEQINFDDTEIWNTAKENL